MGHLGELTTDDIAVTVTSPVVDGLVVSILCLSLDSVALVSNSEPLQSV